MNLDIIVTHYKEPWEVGKKLFDSIAMQEMVNFDDIRVLLVNDGEQNGIDDVNYHFYYPFEVNQMWIPKGGVSKARNAGLDASDADWVMFCDFDDCFSSIFALHMIFCAINEEKYDTLWASFTEETKDSQGNLVLVAHEHDYVFIHGKAHRRQYLVDNNIRFHDRLTIHEDVYFNMMAQRVAKPERIASIKTPIYCWRWNPNSVVRKDKADDYILLTYDHLIRQRIALTEAFMERGMNEMLMITVVKTVVDAFYDSQQTTWKDPKNKELVRKAENWIASYLKRYANLYCKADSKSIAGMVKSSRENQLKKGTFLIETETLSQFLERIVKTAKPINKWEQNV